MPSECEHTFENPGKKPLSQLLLSHTREDGVQCLIKALDKKWVIKNTFIHYVCLLDSTGNIKTGCELEEWNDIAEIFCEDMKFLLGVRQHIFWSYMVYEKTALAAIVSFLQRCTPFYFDVKNSGTAIQYIELYEKILNLVLRIICRLITNKESDEEWIEKEHIKELLYSNYLISIPMLLDIIISVGDADCKNIDILKKIFNTIMKIEPKYKRDLSDALSFFRGAFSSIQTQAENEGFEGAGGGAPIEGEETPYDDVALYTLDCCYTLSVILEVSPEACSVATESKLGQCIAHFYDSTIPFLYKNICTINSNAISLNWLNQARLQLLKAFRSISYSYVETVMNKPEESLLPSENYIALLTECLSEQTFVIDYERQYPVIGDVDIIRQACKDFDEFKANFIVNGYQKEAESESRGTIGNILSITRSVGTDRSDSSVLRNSKANTSVVSNGRSSGDGSSPQRDLDLDVSSVLELLPHLNVKFARYLVSLYDNIEDAIAAYLENKLPPEVNMEEANDDYIPPDPQDKLYEDTGIKRFNVFDGDQYDIMTNNNPNCIIKKGKGLPNTARNAEELLDDKRDLQSIRQRYEEYSLVTENDNDDNDDDDDNEYNDEYDDSYEAFLESETRVKSKSKELKVGLANVDDVSEDDEDENGGEELDQNYDKKNKRLDFCENPEVIRARYEAKRQAKWGYRGPMIEQKKDVVGAPKGQGQDKETLRNRNKKEVKKASRANHNRKQGAAFKRSKGMLS